MADTTTSANTPADPNTDTDDLPLTALFEPNEECICDFGDIVLCADDGFLPPQKLRVSSCVHAMGSKPSKAHLTIASSVKKVEEMCVGVCLDCIRGKECRLSHKHYWPSTGGFEGEEVDEENWDEIQSKIDIFNEADFPGYWDEAW